jgi:hypothetical protein
MQRRSGRYQIGRRAPLALHYEVNILVKIVIQTGRREYQFPTRLVRSQ